MAKSKTPKTVKPRKKRKLGVRQQQVLDYMRKGVRICIDVDGSIYTSNGTYFTPDTVRSLERRGFIRPVEDGLLPGHPQSYELVTP